MPATKLKHLVMLCSLAAVAASPKAQPLSDVIVLNIPHTEYAPHEQAYAQAFAAGTAQALGLGGNAVYVTSCEKSAVGTTRVSFDVELSSVESVWPLFQKCRDGGAAPVGCNAGAESPLVMALQKNGLTMTDAFYNEQYE